MSEDTTTTSTDSDETETEDQPIASSEDFRIQRDEGGDLLPVREPVPGMDKDIRTIPLPDGAANRLIPDSLSPDDMEPAQVVEVLDEYVVEPDFQIDRDRDPEDVLDEFKAFVTGPLMQAVYNASGYDVVTGMVMDSMDSEEFAEFAKELEGLMDDEDGEGNSSPGSSSAEQSTS